MANSAESNQLSGESSTSEIQCIYYIPKPSIFKKYFLLILVCKIRVFSVLFYAISNIFLFFLLIKCNVIRIGRDTTRQKTILLNQLFNCTALLGIQEFFTQIRDPVARNYNSF